ncbi:hypothetical protein J2S13_002277 [Oikeobacillus pervagus]|uniref:Uncharacterized protein n=1 Tax=Oikeobacillus pervagus TaxID=1325931 RepID=A0AAJ1T302_9BACI|nr:hypothetical protein [Oikeobacillus pervagus]MDQ0215857.1 hypothetical protein [Oikeobacillus pervagus]
MFDPTSFENMKVVIEGMIYDLDSQRDICLHGRKDLVDLASFSRIYQIAYTSFKNEKIMIQFQLSSHLHQFASEIMPQQISGDAGCFVEITYRGPREIFQDFHIELLKKKWGPDRVFEERNVDSSQSGKVNELVIQFERLITEEMIPDLQDMVLFSVQTFKLLL